MSNGTIQVESYRFSPDDLNVAGRVPGISAFMRIRDGAYSLEAAIRSHIDHFDEIVAVYNRCTDETPDILERLAQQFGPRLRVFHYLPPVFPPGSDGHRKEAADSPLSLVNYYNFALSRTRFSHATKLDDDHVAMGDATATLVADVRSGRTAAGDMACFSGINLARDAAGRLGVLAREPFSGSGDIGIFPVASGTYFVRDRRFEVLRTGGLRRRFHSFVYWHLKYLKPDLGFSNYDLAVNPRSRYARRLRELQKSLEAVDLPELVRLTEPGPGIVAQLARLGLPVPVRERIRYDRALAARAIFAGNDLKELTARDPELLPFLEFSLGSAPASAP